MWEGCTDTCRIREKEREVFVLFWLWRADGVRTSACEGRYAYLTGAWIGLALLCSR